MELSIDLLISEAKGGYLMFPGVSMITFYDGVAPVEYLTDRVQDIVRYNPWLSGKICRSNKGVTLKYSSLPSPELVGLEIIDDPQINERMSYHDLYDAVTNHKLSVKDGNSLLDKEPGNLFKISLIRISDFKFALFLSICHVIAENRCLYQITEMLSESSGLRSLSIRRYHEYNTYLSTDAVMEDAVKFYTSPGWIINMITRSFFASNHEYNIFQINTDWTQEQISHLDDQVDVGLKCFSVVASWFMNFVKCDLAFVVKDFRNVIHTIPAEAVGNYVAPIILQPDDYVSPDLVERSLLRCRRVCSGGLPGLLVTPFLHIAAISNWAQNYQEADLPGCTQLFHLPFRPPVPFANVAYLFHSRRDKLALLTLSRTKKRMEFEDGLVLLPLQHGVLSRSSTKKNILGLSYGSNFAIVTLLVAGSIALGITFKVRALKSS